VTDWLRSEATSSPDDMDALYPGRARRRQGSLKDYRSCVPVGPGRWRTVAIDGEVAEWVVVTEEKDPWVVKAQAGEHVPTLKQALEAARRAQGRAA
jgi:hypothetical protein